MKLHECHGHIWLGEEAVGKKIDKLKENGIVFFRDGGSRVDSAAELKPRMKENGIDFITPVFALYKENRYGKFLGKSFTDMRSFYKNVCDAKERGADFIKVMYSGIASFKNPGQLTCDPLDKNEIKEIVNIVHGEGMSVMAHCNGCDTIKYAIEYGTDSIEHGIFIDDEGLRMLAYANRNEIADCIWVPTLAAITNEALRSSHKASVEKGAMLGACIAAGSDCGFSAVAIGEGTKTEYALLNECGLAEDIINANCERLRNRYEYR